MGSFFAGFGTAFILSLFLGYAIAHRKFKPLDRPGRQARIVRHLREAGPAFATTLSDDLNMSPKVLSHELVLLSQMGMITSVNVDVRVQQLTHRRLYSAVHVNPEKRGGKHRKPEPKRQVTYLDPEATTAQQLDARGVRISPTTRKADEDTVPITKLLDPYTEITTEFRQPDLAASRKNGQHV